MTARGALILVVEDNPGDLRLLREAALMCESSSRIEGTETVDGALALLRSADRGGLGGRPDVILLDINLPRRRGTELLQELRDDPELASIPVVIFSSSRAEAELAECDRLGARRCLRKPSSIDGFVGILRTAESYSGKLGGCP